MVAQGLVIPARLRAVRNPPLHRIDPEDLAVLDFEQFRHHECGWLPIDSRDLECRAVFQRYRLKPARMIEEHDSEHQPAIFVDDYEASVANSRHELGEAAVELLRTTHRKDGRVR